MGRKRKYKTNAARYRAYRLRQRELKDALLFENPVPGSMEWRVQYAEACRLQKGLKPCVASVKVQQKFRERMRAGLAKMGLA